MDPIADRLPAVGERAVSKAHAALARRRQPRYAGRDMRANLQVSQAIRGTARRG
jgi:hypothetical protein